MKYYGTKVEILLTKAEPGGWSKLALPQIPAKLTETKEEQQNDTSSEDDLDEIEMVNNQAYLKTA